MALAPIMHEKLASKSSFQVHCGIGKHLIDPVKFNKHFWNYVGLGNNFLEYNCLG